MSKSLFNFYEAYTETAIEISEKLSEAVNKILEQYGQEYSTIEIEKILTDCVAIDCVQYRAKKAVNKRINDAMSYDRDNL